MISVVIAGGVAVFALESWTISEFLGLTLAQGVAILAIVNSVVALALVRVLESPGWCGHEHDRRG